MIRNISQILTKCQMCRSIKKKKKNLIEPKCMLCTALITIKTQKTYDLLAPQIKLQKVLEQAFAIKFIKNSEKSSMYGISPFYLILALIFY